MKIRCTNCEYTGKPKIRNRGNMLMTLFLSLFFILPGIIYFLWRVTGREHSCPDCGWKHVVKLHLTK